jgi:hypothetical protein
MTRRKGPFLGALAPLLALAVPSCGGGDKPCGTGAPAPAAAVMVQVGDESFRYAQFIAGENNDCPEPGTFPGPGDPISVTIIGKHEGSGFALSLCLRHPEKIDGTPIDLADPDLVDFTDATAKDAAGCIISVVPGQKPTGTVTFDGFCVEKGVSYNMALAGQIKGTRSCPSDAGPATNTEVTIVLTGRVLVAVAP